MLSITQKRVLNALFFSTKCLFCAQLQVTYTKSVQQTRALLEAKRFMDSLKLGLIGLPDAEARLVATLFRLHGVEPSFIWSLANAAPYDAVLADASVSAEQLRAAAGKGVPVRRLMAVGMAATGSDEMNRPIRSDHLVDWLNGIEVQILHGGSDAFASTNFQAGHASSLQSSGLASSAIPATPAIAVSAPTANLTTGRCKLKRWPPPAVLAADVVRIRAATLLSRRSMSLAELCALSKMAPDRSEAFVRELLERGLLDLVAAVVNPLGVQALSPPLADIPRAAPARTGFGRGLIGSIRRRFGMG